MEVMAITITLIVLLIIGAAVFLWFQSTQRKLVDLDEKCKNAFSQIEVQLNSRWDALLSLAKAAMAYAKHEGETLIKVIEGRRGIEVRTVADVNEQQDAYNDVLSRLMAVREAYPDLKASGLFERTMDSIQEYEENVRMARMVYNDTATRMNRYVRQWPSNIVAQRLGFNVQEYLKADNKQKKDMPDLFTAE